MPDVPHMPGTKTPPPLRYVNAALSTVAATLIRQALDPVVGPADPHIVFYAAVAFSAWFGGFGPALLALALSCLAVDLFSLPPRDPLAAAGVSHRIGLALFAFVGLTLALLTGSLRAALWRAASGESEARRA